MLYRLIAALLAISAVATAVPASAQRLSPAEQQVVRTIDAEQQRTIDQLERWVNQNSGTMNLDGVEAVGRMVRAELEPLGFAVDWVSMREVGRSGHIVARHKGNGRGKRMLLIGHLDTVFEPHSPFQRWERRGDLGVGPGTVDDKGGIAVILSALRAMHRAGTLRGADMTIVLTGDEEDPADAIDVTRAPLIAAGKWADVALDFEGLAREDGRDMASIARRSSGSWTVRVTANSGHSSGIFSAAAGNGAIYELARIIDTFRRELGEDKLTYNVGLVGGGESAKLGAESISIAATGKTNIIPAVAIARGDLRAISADQIARTRQAMQAIVARSLPGTRAEISFAEDSYPPMSPTEGNRALLARLNQVNRAMGLAEMGEYDPARRGAADISFVAGDTDGLAGLGPAGQGSHAPGEAVDIPSIFLQAKRAAILMGRLAREPRR